MWDLCLWSYHVILPFLRIPLHILYKVELSAGQELGEEHIFMRVTLHWKHNFSEKNGFDLARKTTIRCSCSC